MTKIFIRNISVRRLLDNFLVSAAATILVTRAFLFVAGWPSIGGERLHIAHMLWGGLLMAAAIILLISFLGKRVQYIAAALGGIGFGLFIDELGKFITRDNNYFFEPTVMLIYLIFIGLYFIIRELDRNIELTEEERVVNALELSQEVVLERFDAAEKKQLLNLIKLPSHHEPLFKQLALIVSESKLTRQYKFERFGKQIRERYFTFARSNAFAPTVVFFLLLQGALIMLSFRNFWYEPALNTAEQTIVILGGAFALLAAVFVLSALWSVRRNRFDVYRKLYKANLISVLLTQPFAFYVGAFIPVFALAINLLALAALQYLIDLEKRRL